MQRITQPLFRIDPGWLFLLSGILLIGASVLVPQETRLHGLREQLVVLESLERHGERRLEAYDRFLERVESGEPLVMRRLAASQLRITEPGYERVAEAGSARVPVSDWIDDAVVPDLHDPIPMPDTLLARWTAGRHQFWLGGLGAFSAFLGLMLGTGGEGRSQRAWSRTIQGGGLLGPETTEGSTPLPGTFAWRGEREAGAAATAPAGSHREGAD